jgi:hypothetical protein
MSTTTTRALAVASLIVVATTATALAGDDGERAAAIRALYGEGLSIKTSGETVSIDWGSLDAATYERYVAEHYRPFIERVSASLHPGSAAFPGGGHVETAAAARTLVEPALKNKLCVALAESLSDFKASRDAQIYCGEQALRHARAPTVAFRGVAVSYSGVSTFEGVRLDEPIYQGVAVLITVSAPGTLDHFGAWRPVPQLVSDLHYEAPAPVKQLARDTRAWARELSAGAEKRIAARDKRFRKPRGAVVFTGAPVSGWEAIQPLGKNASPSCDAAHAHIYGPSRKGFYDLTVRANKVLCSNSVQSQGFAQHRSIAALCGEHLTAGDNEIEVTIAKNVNRDTGRRRIYVKKDRVEGQKIYSNKAGKRLTTAVMTCTR